MDTDLCALAERLLAVQYSESEIVDYLEGTLGLPRRDAIAVVNDSSRSLHRQQASSS